MDWVLLIGRTVFALLFIYSGLAFHLGKRELAVGYAKMKGAPLPEVTVPLTGIAIVVAGVMIVIGLWVDLAALVIFGFLVPTAYFMHGYWKVADPQEKMMEQTQFSKDLALAGGALILFYLFQQGGESIGITIEPALFD